MTVGRCGREEPDHTGVAYGAPRRVKDGKRVQIWRARRT